MCAHIYIYIYIERERETDISVVIVIATICCTALARGRKATSNIQRHTVAGRCHA